MIDSQKVKDTTNYTLGVGVGYATYKGSKQIIKKPFRKVLDKAFDKFVTNTTLTENQIYFSSAQKAYQNANLKEKGITIHNLNPENCEEYVNRMIEEDRIRDEEFKRKQVEREAEYEAKRRERELKRREEYRIKHGKEYKEAEWEKRVDQKTDIFIKKMENFFEKITKRLEDWVKRMQNENIEGIREIAKGENACYCPASCEVLVNKDIMAFSTFHECGHGITQKASRLGKINAISGAVLSRVGVPVFLAIGLLKNNKKEGERPKGFFDTINTFIKNNCALLTFACFVPTLVDEAMASINGAKLAKPVLNKEMYIKLLKKQGWAYSTYLLGSLLTCGLVKLAVKTRDTMVESKVVK